MQIILARGLFSNWKQPLCINVDTQVNRGILNEVIQTTKSPYFSLSNDWPNVYVFADALHILK